MAADPGVRRSELGDALRACRNAFIGVGIMSCVINLLYLTGSIFMLEVYDRVIPSRNLQTLVGLCALALLLFAVQGVLDVIRGRVLGRGFFARAELSGWAAAPSWVGQRFGPGGSTKKASSAAGRGAQHR